MTHDVSMGFTMGLCHIVCIYLPVNLLYCDVLLTLTARCSTLSLFNIVFSPLFGLQTLEEEKERKSECLPPEPPADDAESVKIVFKLPNDTRVERRFLFGQSLTVSHREDAPGGLQELWDLLHAERMGAAELLEALQPLSGSLSPRIQTPFYTDPTRCALKYDSQST